MKTRQLLISISIGILILVATLTYLAVPRSEALAKSKFVIGSWNVVITVVNQNATFPGFITFFNDGNVIADEVPSPLETSGHGSWVGAGNNRYAYRFDFLYGSTEPGKWMKGTVSGSVNYDQETDQWSGPFAIVIVDQDGNEVLSDMGIMNGRRIPAELDPTR